MPIFRKQDDRQGLRFWLPLSACIGAGISIVLLILGVLGGNEGIRNRYGVSGIEFLVTWNILAVTAGIIVGLLNPYVASAWAAVLVAIVALYPASVLASALTYGSRTSVGVVLLGALFPSLVGGVLYGLLLYEPS